MNTRVASGDYAALSVDNYGGATAMMRHLLGRGFRRIAFIGGPGNNFDADERLRGYREVLAQNGGAERLFDGDFSEASGYRAGLLIAALRERPDAIFAANDTMALGCLFALTEHGLSVPDDIALAGFDDIPIARFVTPPLTTVRVRIAELGRLALERLAALIETGAVPPAAEPLACDLIVRASTGNAAAGAAADSS
jgi:LacI family transcriptional regulator